MPSKQKRFLVQRTNRNNNKKVIVGTFYSGEEAQQFAKIQKQNDLCSGPVFDYNVIYVERKYIR